MKPMRIFVVAYIMFATIFTANADNDRAINFEQLPEKSKTFIDEYFKGVDISYIKEERELLSKSYEVFFVDGSKVEFDTKGEWDTVDSFKDAIPEGIAPAEIVKYVEERHPSTYIVSIERDRKDYEVELNNNLEIKFDKMFNVIRYDD